MRIAFFWLCIFLLLISAGRIIAAENWWPDATKQALSQAGANRAQLVAALEKTPVAQRGQMQFLIENAPLIDLQNLSADFLLQNLALANDAFTNAPWRAQIPPDIFLNDILPYACVNETRDGWRAMLREKCAPLVADCQTPGEAALRLNAKIFDLVHVHYSTARKKADQSPAESMQSGLASCTGLSILLVDACRSVGVPARLTGTPDWWDNRGNHSWVEIWDHGWHFIGASEPDPKGLDHAWFVHDASLAQANVPQHAIYAASFKKTGLLFPVNWTTNNVNWIYAENVTTRYATHSAAKNISAAPGKIRLLVKVIDANGHRVPANVTVSEKNSTQCFAGVSKNELADLNNVLTFEIPARGVYQIRAALDNQSAEQIFTPTTNAQQIVVLVLDKNAK